MEPLISIIVPVYNAEPFLQSCIDSILNQSYQNLELVLVEDGSPDGSGAICDRYAQKDERVKVIHKQNEGVSRARNDGIEKASGEFVTFVDSDDMLEPEMLLDCYQNNSNACIVLCGLKYMDAETNACLRNCVPEKTEKWTAEEFVKRQFLDLYHKNIIHGPCNKLFRKEPIDRYHVRFHPEYSICEDMLFVLQYLRHCQSIATVAKSYYHYRQHAADSLMKKFNENAFASNTALYLETTAYLQTAGANAELLREIDKSFCQRYFAFLLQLFTRSGKTFREKYRIFKQYAQNEMFLKTIRETALPNQNMNRIGRFLQKKRYRTAYLLLSVWARGKK